MTLEERYQRLLSCPELIDTRDHLPLFRSLTGRILEIGCDVGNSTTAFLVGQSESVTSIDINPACGKNFPDERKWHFICADSHSVMTLDSIIDQVFDVLFIDGDHSYEGAQVDLDLYSGLVRPGGLILMHDVLCPDTYPGVRRAFDEFPRGNKSIREGSYGLGVIEL